MYKKIGNGIEKNLGNTQYTIMAQPTWDNGGKVYNIRLFIGHEKLDLLKELTEFNLCFKAERNDVYKKLDEIVGLMDKDGKFVKAVVEFDYIVESVLRFRKGAK